MGMVVVLLSELPHESWVDGEGSHIRLHRGEMYMKEQMLMLIVQVIKSGFDILQEIVKML